jgi:hypothetical protein
VIASIFRLNTILEVDHDRIPASEGMYTGWVGNIPAHMKEPQFVLSY